MKGMVLRKLRETELASTATSAATTTTAAALAAFAAFATLFGHRSLGEYADDSRANLVGHIGEAHRRAACVLGECAVHLKRSGAGRAEERHAKRGGGDAKNSDAA